APAMRVAALTTVARVAGTAAPANKLLAESCLTAVVEAVAEEKPEAATQLLKLAGPAAKPALVEALSARVQTLGQAARDAQKDPTAARAAADVLRDKPDDPDASLTRGKYLCFRKGDWEAGLPLLAAGKDPALQALAKKDLAKPTMAAERVEAGNGW